MSEPRHEPPPAAVDGTAEMGALDTYSDARTIVVPLHWAIYAKYKVGWWNKCEAAAAALRDYHDWASRNDAATGFAAAGEDSGRTQLTSQQLFALRCATALSDSSTDAWALPGNNSLAGDAEAHMASVNSENALERLQFIVDVKSYEFTSPRLWIVVPTLVVLMIVWVSVAALTLSLREKHLRDRQTSFAEDMRTQTMLFGTAFETEFVTKALFETADQVKTLAAWTEVLFQLEQRELKMALEFASEKFAATLSSTAAGWVADRRTIPNDLVANVAAVAARLSANSSLPQLDRATSIAAVAQLLSIRCPWLDAAVVAFPTVADVAAGRRDPWNDTTVVLWSSSAGAATVPPGAPLLTAHPEFFVSTCVTKAVERYHAAAMGPAGGPPTAFNTTGLVEDAALFTAHNRTDAPGVGIASAFSGVARRVAWPSAYSDCWVAILPSIPAALIIRSNRTAVNRDLELRLAETVTTAGAALRAEALPGASALKDDATEVMLVAVDLRPATVAVSASNADVAVRWTASCRLLSQPSLPRRTPLLRLSNNFTMGWLHAEMKLTSADLSSTPLTAAQLDARLAGIRAPRLEPYAPTKQATTTPLDGVLAPSYIPSSEVGVEIPNHRYVATWAPLAFPTTTDCGGTYCFFNSTRTVYVWVAVHSTIAIQRSFLAFLRKAIAAVNADATVACDLYMVEAATAADANDPTTARTIPLLVTTPPKPIDGNGSFICGVITETVDGLPPGACPTVRATISASKAAFYVAPDGAIAVKGSGSVVSWARSGEAAVLGYGAVPALGVVMALTNPLVAIKGRARAAFSDAVLAYSSQPGVAAPDGHADPTAVDIVALGPAHKSFDDTAACDINRACRWAHRWNATKRTWTAGAVVARSDCDTCVPALVGKSKLSSLVRQSSLGLSPDLVTMLTAALAPYRPTAPRPLDPLIGARQGPNNDAVAGTVLVDGVVTSYAASPDAGFAVVVTVDIDESIGHPITTDTGIIAAVAYLVTACGLGLLWAVGALVQQKVQHEFLRSKEQRRREQMKLTQLTKGAIPPAWSARIPDGRNVVSDLCDVGVVIVDHVHFSDVTAAWSARDVLRYTTYWRHMVTTIAAQFKATVLGQVGDQVHVITGLSGGTGSGLNGAALDALRFATTIVRLASYDFTHRPWLVDSLANLFQLTTRERADARGAGSASLMESSARHQLSQRRGLVQVPGMMQVAQRTTTAAEADAMRFLGSPTASEMNGSQPSNVRRHTVAFADATAGVATRSGLRGRDDRQPDLTKIAMTQFELLPVRAGVHVGGSVVVAARLPQCTPTFDCFSSIFAVANRLQSTAPPGRVHVSSQTKDIANVARPDAGGTPRAAALAPPSLQPPPRPDRFDFSTPLRTVMKGGQNVTSFLVNIATIAISDDALHQLAICRTDRSYKFEGDGKLKPDSASETGGSSDARSRSSASVHRSPKGLGGGRPRRRSKGSDGRTAPSEDSSTSISGEDDPAPVELAAEASFNRAALFAGDE